MSDPLKSREVGARLRGLPLQVFIFIFLPLTLILLGVVFGSYFLHHQAMRSLVGDRDLRAVRAAALEIGKELGLRRGIMETLGRMFKRGMGVNSFLSVDLGNRLDAGVAVYERDGHLIDMNPVMPYWQTLPESQASFWQALGEDVAFSSPLVLAGSSDYLVLVGMRRTDGIVLVGAFSPSVLAHDALSEYASGGGIELALIDPMQSILYQVGDLGERKSFVNHHGVTQALRGESGVDYIWTAGDEHIVAFSPVQPVGWALVIEESWMEIAGPLLNVTLGAPLVLVPVLIVALGILWFGVQQIVQPLRRLGRQAAELGRGNFAALEEPSGGVSEIRNLQAELLEMAQQLKTAQASLHAYIGAITDGIENERRSLGRELHDDTLQTLIALNQRLQLAELKPNTLLKDEKIHDLIGTSINSLRRIVRGLRPPYLDDLGLGTALSMMVEESQQVSGVIVDFNLKGVERRLSGEVELALFRIAQEALSNAVRHADASHIRIEIGFFDEQVSLSISDDGKGFVLPSRTHAYASKGHFGLLGMKERADLIGATLRLDAKLNGGTRVEVVVSNLQ